MARWGRGRNRAFGHVHNWQIRIVGERSAWTTNERGWPGVYVDRIWECIRGGKVKHISPSLDYPVPTGLYGQRSDQFDVPIERRVFLAASGYDYHAHDTY